MNYAFSEAALRDAETFLHSNIDRWLELLGQQTLKEGEASTPVNMSDWVNWLVFDILGDLCFGTNFNMKESTSKLRHIPEVMATFLELLHPVRTCLCTSVPENMLMLVRLGLVPWLMLGCG